MTGQHSSFASWFRFHHGIFYCIAASLLYTTSNSLLRYLVDLDAHRLVAMAGREVIAALVLGPWVLWRCIRDSQFRPSWKMVLLLTATGLVTMTGSYLYYLGFEVIGMGVTIALVFSSMLVVTAVLGRIFLKEQLTKLTFTALLLLIMAIAMVSLGVPSNENAASENAAASFLPCPEFELTVPAAVISSILAGVAFAILNIVLRYAGKQKVHIAITMVFITGIAAIVMYWGAYNQGGIAAFAETTTGEWQIIGLLGLCNLFAFFCLNKGFKLTRAIQANITTSSQVALAVVMGVLFFGETTTLWLYAGVAATIAGIVLIGCGSEE